MSYEYDVSEDIRAEDWDEEIIHEEVDDDGNYYYYTEYKGNRVYKERW